MIICFWSPIRVSPHCGVGRWLAVVWPKHRGGESSFYLSLWGSRIGLFSQFLQPPFDKCSYKFIIISAFLSRMAFCEPGSVNRVSWADFWLNFRRLALDIWANSLKDSCWSFRLSTGVARVQAIVASQNGRGLPSRPALPNSPGTVLALSCCQKHRAGGVAVLRL